MLLFGCSVLPAFAESPVVAITTYQALQNRTDKGTGVIVDAEDGLVLTARHGVYLDDNPVVYNAQYLVGQVTVRPEQTSRPVEAYVVHISQQEDLALLKVVDAQFDVKGVFLNDAGFLQKNDTIHYEGYPAGDYRFLSGSIANVQPRYLALDMEIAGGMSGGPIYALQEKGWLVDREGIAGIVVLKTQEGVGGHALRAEIVNNYLQDALPQARRVKIPAPSCVVLQDVRLRPYYDNEDEIQIRIQINYQQPLFSLKYSMQSGLPAGQTFELHFLPGSRLEISVWQQETTCFFSCPKTQTFHKVYEGNWPQIPVSVPNFNRPVTIENGNVTLSFTPCS